VICADSSSFIAFIQGEVRADVALLTESLTNRQLVLAPVSVVELLSDPQLPVDRQQLILQIPILEIKPGYWERAGQLGAALVKRKYRPKIADTLIAQSCLDHDVPLITRDQDFKPFQKHAGLRLL
jgi:predicted nucleic acid-binding protein